MKTSNLISINRASLANGDILILPCQVNFYHIERDDQVKEAIEEILPYAMQTNGAIAVDVETTGLDPYIDSIILLQIGTSDNIQYIFDFRTITELDLLKPILESPCKKLGHNIKFDAEFIKVKLGAEMSNFFDTMLAERIIRGGEYFGGEKYSLDAILQRRLSIEMKIISNNLQPGVDPSNNTDRAKSQMQKSFGTASTTGLSQAQLAYAAQDVSADTIFKLAQWQTTKLKEEGPNTIYNPDIELLKDKHIKEEYEKVFPKNLRLWETALLEFRFLEVVIDMELRGIGFSKETHEKVLENINKDYKGYRNEFLKILGKKTAQKTLFNSAAINPDSSKQVLEALNGLKLDLDDTNSKNLEVKLEQLTPGSYEHGLLSCLLSYRGMSKLVQAFGTALVERIHKVTNRIHFDIKQVLDTGRISTSNPNIQQIPSNINWKMSGNPEEDAVIKQRPGLRECFQAKPEHQFVVFDYDSQELRVAASITLEKTMLSAFINNRNLHCYSAVLMYGGEYEDFYKRYKSGDETAKQQRTAAKTVSFGALYGSGAPNLSKTLNIPREHAQDIIDRFWGSYPDLKASMDRFGKFANKLGYSNTVLGRRRYYTDIIQRIRWVEVDFDPTSIEKKLVDEGMQWFLDKEEDGITRKNMDKAKGAIIRKYQGNINRQAANHHIQGTSADMTKLAAYQIYSELKNRNLDAHIVGLVHDEIIVETPNNNIEEVKEIVECKMKEALNFFCPNVPAAAEGKVQECWKK